MEYEGLKVSISISFQEANRNSLEVKIRISFLAANRFRGDEAISF